MDSARYWLDTARPPSGRREEAEEEAALMALLQRELGGLGKAGLGGRESRADLPIGAP